MKHSLSRTLPGFKMFNAFFSDLKGAFEPTILTEKQKAVFPQAIAALDGSPKEALRPLREDFGLTAKVREARKYEDGRTFVRYEFNRLESNCTWSRPYQLGAAFREAERVDSLGLTHPIPSSALPPEDWFSIDSIVADLRLTALARRESVLDGYFLDSAAPDGE